MGDPVQSGEPVQVLVEGRQAGWRGQLPHDGRDPADGAGQPSHPQAGPQEVAQSHALQGKKEVGWGRGGVWPWGAPSGFVTQVDSHFTQSRSPRQPLQIGEVLLGEFGSEF